MNIKEMKKNSKKSGFTLLELLVVVAIIAAIAGSVSMAFKDTDARAAAAAHVGMMNELNKGVRTFSALRHGVFPTRMDSMLFKTADTNNDDNKVVDFSIEEDAEVQDLTADVAEMLVEAGVEDLMYIDEAASPVTDGITRVATDATGVQEIIMDRDNMVVAGNMFLPVEANGCGTNVTVAAGIEVLIWKGENARLTGQSEDAGVYMLTGLGPASNLFDPNELAGMSTTPIYRHVDAQTYNRFIAVWRLGTMMGANNEPAPGATPSIATEYATDTAGFLINDNGLELITILDGALDTKEEELGEWEGSRHT